MRTRLVHRVHRNDGKFDAPTRMRASSSTRISSDLTRCSSFPNVHRFKRIDALARLTLVLRVVLVTLVGVLVLAPIRGASADSPQPPPFVVIVHPDNPHPSLERGFVAEAFLKKTTRWPNGDVIKPVDLQPDSPVREKFSNAVLKRSVAAVKSYWQQIIFAGRDVPPPELASEDEIVKYVPGHANAIGYVSGRVRLGDVRVVTLR